MLQYYYNLQKISNFYIGDSSMHLKKYYFLRLKLPLILFFIIFTFSITIFLNKVFVYFDQKYTDEQSHVVHDIIEHEKDLISKVLSEYAHWDEFYFALKSHDLNWIEKFVVSDIKSTHKYELIYILDENKNKLVDNGKNIPSFNIHKNNILKNTFKNSKQYVEITRSYNDFYIISSSPVFDNLGTQKPSGYIFIAEKLNKENIKLLNHIYDYQEASLVNNFEVDMNIKDSNVFYVPLKDSKSNIIGFIKLTLKQNTIRKYIHDTNILFITISLLVLLIFIYSTNKLTNAITNRLQNTINEISLISKGNYNIRLDESVKTYEFKQLAHAVNNLTNTVEEKIHENNRNYIEIIQSIMSALEVKDAYTLGHSNRVAHYSKRIAERLNLNNIDEIEVAALIHDIGKIGIPDSILNKPGRLTDQEFDIIKTHPEKGYIILEKISLMNNIKYIVKCHHERIDGKGYPLGLKDYEIPIESKIISVADAFDAMTSDRCYRGKFDTYQAVNILSENAGSQFDPIIVDCFIDIINEDIEKENIMLEQISNL